jgi:uncharacterized protein YceH (UPF0502 family)
MGRILSRKRSASKHIFPDFQVRPRAGAGSVRKCPRLDLMDFQLETEEARVLGALLEKEITTPDYYPLSLNALVNACNQKSNRDPVVAYDEAAVENALAGLRTKGLATRITGADSRVPKHSQRFTERYNLGRREAALICVLLLRGPQTVGELRGRAERLYSFDDLEAVSSTLDRLGEMGFAAQLPRQAGSREPRFAHLLSGEVAADLAAPPEAPAHAAASLADRVAELERNVEDLRRQFDDFRRNFE